MTRVKLLMVGLVVALAGLMGTAVAHAQSGFRAGTDVTVAAGEVIDQTLFASGSTIDIAGTVNGDVFCAGQEVTITGNVTGDIVCAGQTVNIAANVGGNIRVAGQTVTIGGQTARNLTVAGQSLIVQQNSKVAGDASVLAQSATLNGSVGRDVAASAVSLTMNGTVNRDVQVMASDKLSLGSSALVGGSVTYSSNQRLVRETGAHVGGSITRKALPAKQRSFYVGAVIGGGFVFMLYFFIALLVVSLAVVLVAPQFVHDAAELAIRSPWKTLLIGFAASIAVPAIIFALMCTVIGIPLALLAGLVWLVTTCLAVPFAAYYFGRLLIGARPANKIGTMLLGAAIILVLYMIPLIGFVVWLAAMWFGLGIIVRQVPRLPRPNYE